MPLPASTVTGKAGAAGGGGVGGADAVAALAAVVRLAASGQSQHAQQRAREGRAYGPHERSFQVAGTERPARERRITLFHEG